ncbi:MAG: hypothetical protein L0216_11045 [Planctomycetales bacterium]|nr:hypothetical protein [Planctomycetales bacterium]
MVSDPSSGPDTLRAVAADISQVWCIWCVGSDESQGTGDSQWRIEKRNQSDGNLVVSFGTGGVISSNPGSGQDEATCVFSDGSHLFVGGFDSSPGDRQWRIEKRLLSDGSLDLAFGASGVITSNPSTGQDEVSAIAWDGTDLFVVGFDEGPGTGDFQWRIEKRSGVSGALVSGFGSSGVVTSNPSTAGDVATTAGSIGTVVGSLDVGGYDAGPGNRQWRIERRLPSNGNLDTSFGSGGVVTVNPSAGSDEVAAIAEGTDLIVVGTDESPGAGDSQWRIEKRGGSSGTLVSGFGTGGVVTVNPSSGGDRPYFAAVVSTYWFYIAGADASPSVATGDNQWRVEKRWTSTGAPLAEYGAGGVATSNPSVGSDRVLAATSRGPVAVFAGTQGNLPNTAWRIEAR